ncbi:MAG: hypothetical protein V3V14_14880 [Saprospiraceae bacterium]
MKSIFKSLIVLLVVAGTVSLNGQVESVSFDVVQNDNTGNFDIFLVVEKGSAASVVERTQFNSQISFVASTGTDIDIVDLNMPLNWNQKFNGQKPMLWIETTKVIAPDVSPELDYFAVSCVMAPVSQYNDLLEGDKVRLFSVSVKNNLTAKPIFRLYKNGHDADSNAEGMGGGDFSIGFTIGGVRQKYRDVMKSLE